MTTKTPETLETQIERLVREHVLAQQLAAKAAVDRAFAVMSAPRVSVQRRAAHTWRAPAEVADLAEQLFEAVQACPGETMTTIAARVGEKPRALNRPMLHLKRAGRVRVRSAGERNLARYFPMPATKSA